MDFSRRSKSHYLVKRNSESSKNLFLKIWFSNEAEEAADKLIVEQKQHLILHCTLRSIEHRNLSESDFSSAKFQQIFLFVLIFLLIPILIFLVFLGFESAPTTQDQIVSRISVFSVGCNITTISYLEHEGPCSKQVGVEDYSVIFIKLFSKRSKFFKNFQKGLKTEQSAVM